MNKCGTCRFFGSEERDYSEWDSERDEPNQSPMYRVCGLLEHLNKAPGTIHKEWPKAGVTDGSGYYAALVVREEFGCVEWQARLPASADPKQKEDV